MMMSAMVAVAGCPSAPRPVRISVWVPGVMLEGSANVASRVPAPDACAVPSRTGSEWATTVMVAPAFQPLLLNEMVPPTVAVAPSAGPSSGVTVGPEGGVLVVVVDVVGPLLVVVVGWVVVVVDSVVVVVGSVVVVVD